MNRDVEKLEEQICPQNKLTRTKSEEPGEGNTSCKTRAHNAPAQA